MRETDICVQSSFGHTIKNRLLAQEPRAEALAVLFPGGNGTCDIPLLHYARKVALQAACDVLSIEYGYVRTEHSLSWEMHDALLQEARQAVEACDLPKYRRIYFISKSLGTLIAGELAEKLRPAPICSLYLTPLEGTVAHIEKSGGIVVTGDQDRLFPDASILQTIPGIDLHVFAGANHSLEVPNDYHKSLELLTRVADICHRFLRAD